MLGIGAACFLFYLGGSYSFRYTHVCAHSHKKVVFKVTDVTETRTITVCDTYSGNGKHWSPGDPARALYSEPLTGWNEAIVIGLALAIVVAVLYELLYERRKNRRRHRTERS